jgi:solute carrier family 8 (sodium/calcium exchanger)
VFLIILVLWLLLGIAVLSDIFAESIAFITSEVSSMEVIDYEGKSIMIGLSVWNPRIANVTLLALGSSAPEIFMCFINTFVSIDDVPSEMGPMVLMGSATFNMLVVIGICIFLTSEVKRILRWRTFFVTFFFGTFAYFWLFLVVYIFSPFQIESWEAILTMLFYPLMVYSVWMVESPNAEEKQLYSENMNKQICKAMLQNKASVRGKIYVIDLATGQGGDNDDTDEERKTIQYFCTCLEVDNLNKVSVD